YVRHLDNQSTAVLLTTHHLGDAADLCDTIAIIDHGALLAHEQNSTRLQGVDRAGIHFGRMAPLTEVPESLKVLGAEVSGQGDLVVSYQPSKADMAAIMAQVCAAGLTIRDVTTEQARLEEVFRHLTRKIHVA